MSKKLKDPSDYPQFSFRLSESEKEWLQNELQAVADLMNRSKEPGERLVRGNHVALMALRKGLETIRSEMKTKK